MSVRYSLFPWLTALTATLALVILLAACGSDPEPTDTLPTATDPTAVTAPTQVPTPTDTPVPPTEAPEPTATPEPSATPEPTAMPEPTPEPEPTAAPQAMTTIEDMVITEATTGGDLMALLSEAETSCIQASVGDALYQLVLGTPIMLMAAGDISQTAPLFHCLEPDNVIHLAVAFLDVQAGGWSEESRSCITQVGLEHPDAVFIRLGMDLGDGPVDPTTTLEYNIGFFDCLSNEEKMQYTLGIWMALDRVSPATGADVFALLTEEEAACASDALSAEQLAGVVNATPLQAVTLGAVSAECIGHESNISIFVHGIDWSLGGTTEETRACLEGFAEANPDYINLFTSGFEGMYAMPADEFVRITEVGNDQYACMTEDEILRVQHSVTAALSAPPAQ